MSTYDEAVAAQRVIETQFGEDPNCFSVTIIPQPSPANFAVQVICTGQINGLPSEVGTVAVLAVDGIPAPSDQDLNAGAQSSYTALDDADAGAVLQPPTVYFISVSAPQVFNLPRAFITAGEVRIKNSGTQLVTVAAFSGDTIDGSPTLVLDPSDSACLFSDGNSNWARFF